MLALKLAFKNLIGAGLRTWLNVFVLSLSFVIIIWHKGMLDGWDRQAKTDMIAWESGGGQYWQQNYDPYDPFTLTDSHAPIPQPFDLPVKQGKMLPILITQGSIYPEGRVQSILIKGIDPAQKLLAIPSKVLGSVSTGIPALIGQHMAQANRLKVGDVFSMRWRRAEGAFDAADAIVVGIFHTTVPSIDAGQLWVPLETLRKMLNMPGQATLLITSTITNHPESIGGWKYKSQEFLLSDVEKIIKAKTVGGAAMWFILMLLAMLAIFDTQVLSIFRRQKEIGTCIALGMTKGQVIRLFTVEGAMHSVFAALLALAWGTPLLYLQAVNGIHMPINSQDFGISIADVLYPTYSFMLIITTTLIVLITTTIVSYIPSRKIARMNPTDAIRGKIR